MLGVFDPTWELFQSHERAIVPHVALRLTNSCFMNNESRRKEIFRPAAKELLEYLHRRLGFQLWMVTRTSGEDWVALVVEDQGYGVKSGDVFKWSDSFCSRMVAGRGPRISPESVKVQAYAEAPIARQVPIGAYVGVPLHYADGKLFGTLCAIDPYPQPELIERELPQIEMLASMLEKVLEGELVANLEHRISERTEAEALVDPQSGLYNRRGWEELVAAEEHRCRRYSHRAAVFAVNVEELVAGSTDQTVADKLLQSTARILLNHTRRSDVVARVSEGQFLLLAVECHEEDAEQIVQRLQEAFAAEEISASFGHSVRGPKLSIATCAIKAQQSISGEQNLPISGVVAKSADCADPEDNEMINLLDTIQW